jgi:hypothetical protein
MTITLTREEAQQVLDAFVNWDARGRLRLIETLRARLAQPEQRTGDCLLAGVCAAEGHRIQKTQPEPEPVAWLHSFTGYGWQVVPEKLYPTDQPLYTAPPQREWQGLTDEEIHKAAAATVEGERMLPYSFARAIEAKLKEKNSI